MNNIVPNLLKNINTPVEIIGVGNADKRQEKYAEDRKNAMKLSLALALIKLLQKLPKIILEEHLTNIVFKISSFLKSNSKAVRVTAKDVLTRILATLGSNYLEPIIMHLSSTLSKGNEIHVLTVTTNRLIDAVKNTLKATHFDAVLQIVLKTCLNDIFRISDNYRKGLRLLNRRNEAKPSKKSYLSLGIMANGISEACILDVLVPIKNILAKVHSRTDLLKVQECLDNIVSGLCRNPHVSKESLLTLIHGILNENINQLIISSKDVSNGVNNHTETKVKNVNSLLVPPEPKRKGAISHNVSKWKCDTNAFVLTQFAFKIFHILLKRKLVISNQYKEYIDSLLPFVANSMHADEIAIKMFGMKCITCLWNSQYKSDALCANEPSIVKALFDTIQKFIDQSIVRKEENMLLIRNSFKGLVAFIRNVKVGRINTKQIELMLLYVNNEMDNPDTKSMAYPLLKTILDKKLKSKTINVVVRKVADLSLFSEFESIKNESRLIVMSHIKNYPSKLNQDYYMKLYCKNLDHKTQSIKVSSLQMLNSILKIVNEVCMK